MSLNNNSSRGILDLIFGLGTTPERATESNVRITGHLVGPFEPAQTSLALSTPANTTQKKADDSEKPNNNQCHNCTNDASHGRRHTPFLLWFRFICTHHSCAEYRRRVAH